MDSQNDRPYDLTSDQTQAWLRRILDEQVRQTEQLRKVARAAQLYFWLTIIGLLLGICGPLAIFALSAAGIIGSMPGMFQ